MNFYDRPVFDRAGHYRTDNAWLDKQIKQESSRAVPIWRSRNLVADLEKPRLTTVPMNAGVIDDSPFMVFLGLLDGIAHFAVDLSHHKTPPFSDMGQFADLRQIGTLMPREEGTH